MTNKELMNIYKQALNDWKDLQVKFNKIEDKTIENIKKEFADQCEEQGLFFTINHGCIEAYLSDYKLEEQFTIKYKEYVQPYVTFENINKRIESLS